ncbi:MAG: hypothetical protein V4558_15695 [Gemmatimonadota bacterium]
MRRLLPLLALLVVGCSDLVSPLRTGPYDYRQFVSKGTPDGAVDTVTFHWPRSALPVRVWVGADDPLKPHMQLAISRWKAAFLYGEFDAVMVDDSSRADVIVRNIVAPPIGGLLMRAEAFAPECRGATDIPFNLTNHTVLFPFRIYIYSRFTPDPPGLDGCYRITATHELGHALGLLRESPNIGDIMFGDPVVDQLSEQDRITAETLYHLPSRLAPGPRR